MVDNLFQLAKCIRCGWLFVPSRYDAVRCNPCGNNTYHPRVCREDDHQTNWTALRRLARYVELMDS